jgi:hypothetical protein
MKVRDKLLGLGMNDSLRLFIILFILSIPHIIVAKILWNHPLYGYIGKGIVILWLFGAIGVIGIVVTEIIIWVLKKLNDFVWR